MAAPTMGERLDAWQKRNAIVVVLLFLAVVVSSIITLASNGARAFRWAFGGTSWQSRETHVISSLVAGYSLQTFVDRLGAPVFVRHNGGYTESSFQRHGYWVQTLSDKAGTTAVFAVTVCSPRLHPVFVAGGHRLSLGQSTFADVGRGSDVTARYTVGNTANNNFIEYGYGGNPGNYKTYVWGFDDACPSWASQIDRFPFSAVGFGYEGPVLTNRFRVFRSTVVLNTYAETAPTGQDIAPLLRRFQVGVDRVLVRTAAPTSGD